MKRLLIIIYSCLLCIYSCAAKIKIDLSKTEEKTQSRSLIIEPTAYYEACTIYLQSEISIEGFQVTVKDEEGNIISSESIFLSSQQTYELPLGNLENGTYILELNDGKHEYWGYFEVE